MKLTPHQENEAAHAYARNAVEAAFREEMESLMAGALAHRSSTEHDRWLEAARSLLEQRHAALLWQVVAFSDDEEQIRALTSIRVFEVRP